ncbi:FAD-dependent oxidoreductase [Jatrophihabitans lederbergiae]|uniref:NAD(P)-binding protein n=1 Tax=Jatrophihabitans lederbergiae TaxID=3075547 RepID=A0ABU2J5L4_9ACTN|nr:FAD-dependent oxidoreductase [Jatrophihabitans sp. DSM 44399]MDT0260277.1 NAD(P)-binding protein [Jatrophihabitans sp. DSM 44399]
MGSGSVIQDLRTTRDLRTAADAVLVVGSGAAGLALAQRVSESGRSVVVLESGGDLTATSDPGTDTADLNEGLNLGLAYTGLRDGRSRNLGGTTQLWHGQCMRLHPIDVRPRPWVPHSGWPIALTDLDEHYAAAERWLGVTGRGYGPERWQEHPELAPLPGIPPGCCTTSPSTPRNPCSDACTGRPSSTTRWSR